MPTLNLSLLGPPLVELERQSVEIPSRKAVALLAYLAITGQPHSREHLAALLWPEADTEHARGALRAALAALRRAVGDTWIVAERDTLSLGSGDRDQESGDRRIELDVARFRAEIADARMHPHAANAACPVCQANLSAAADLYRDDLLAGFTLSDCPAFDEWLFFEAEGLRHDLADVLQRLAASHTANGELELAIAATRRWLALDPLHEPAHRTLIHLYALAGQRSAALRQYDECERILAAELDCLPSAETRSLQQEIRAGHIRPLVVEPAPDAARPRPPIRLPAFLEEVTAEPPRQLFVARTRELARLHAFLDTTRRGRGQVAFVTGEAGAGKSSLLSEFLRQASDRYPDLLAAGGACTALGGLGDPYLPFRQALAMLTGDLAGRLAAGSVSRSQAIRLWEALPETLGTLVERGPVLPGLLLSPAALLARAEEALPADEPNLARLRRLAARADEASVDLKTGQLFSETTDFLARLAVAGPLLLILDDLQWADAGSVNLLYHLTRGLSNAPILIVAAYRPEEIAPDGPHAQAIAEIKRLHGDTWIELDALVPGEGRAFVDAYLDASPNALGSAFRAALHAHTDGHALFTAETLRHLRETDFLVQDTARGWIEAQPIDWSVLPARVEGVIEGRLGRLPIELRELLAVASVEGEEFTAQVIAHAMGQDERAVLRMLERDLGQTHRLVRWLGSVQVGDLKLERFGFRHALFQQHCYAALGAVERRLYHGDIAAGLEACYGHAAEELAPALGWHWEQAGEGAKAIRYLLAVGDRARLTYANSDAIGFYTRALALLKAQGDNEGAARTLMRLGLVHSAAADFARAEQVYSEGFEFWRKAIARSESATHLPPAPCPLRVPWYPGYRTENLWLPTERFRYHLFAGLVEESPFQETVPDVAEGWDISPDGCTYTFHLRRDACWSDGVPVTAADFVYAWRHNMAPEIPDEDASLFDDIRGARAFHQGQITNLDDLGVTAAGPHTLIVRLERSAAYFLHILALPIAMPLPSHLGENGEIQDTSGRFVSNGPFVVEAISPDELVVLSRNSTYCGRFTGNLERVEIDQTFAPRRWEDALERYRSDRLHAISIFNYPPEAFAIMRRSCLGEMMTGPAIGSGVTAFDVTRSPFDDIRVRRAFQRSIDRVDFQRRFNEGRPTTIPSAGGMVPPGLPGHSPGIAPAFDLVEARRLLADAGYPDGQGFPHTIWLGDATPGAEYTDRLLNEHLLRNMGLTIELQFLEGMEYVVRSAAATRPMAHMSWFARRPRYPDPDDVLRAGGQRLWRMVGCRDTAFDHLVEAARSFTDSAERMAAYRQAEEILMREAYIWPNMYWRDLFLLKPWVKRFPLSPLGIAVWEDVVIEPHD